ncbi:MAG: type II toxin-antitoxin system VapC family toxin [bacterium]|nr:type II toxin-antitoxin system VapC family toxin [bacterium]
MNKSLVETTILIDYFRRLQKAIDCLENLRNKGKVILVPRIVSAELFFGCRNTYEEREIENFLLNYVVTIDISVEIMKKGAELKRTYGKSYECGLIDMLIASTALIENAELVTLNIKHFQMIEQLSIVKPY